MGNLKEIRSRIASVSSTQKITMAMKLVSAAKLRRAQTSIINLRPYANKLDEILKNLSLTMENSEDSPLFEKRDPDNVVLVVITSNRGLCGSFNSNVIKEVHRIVREKYAIQESTGKLKLVCFGKKGYEHLCRHYKVEYFNESLLDNSSFKELSVITDRLIQGFLNRKIDKIDIIYNQFVNPATQKVVRTPYLPIVNETPSCKTRNNIDFIFEPSKDELLEELIPKILRIKMFKSLIDSIASEHGARMTAMAKASDNADEMLKELKLKYNNARQSSITTELLEIISGANALDS